MNEERENGAAERLEAAADRLEEAAQELSRTSERVEKALGETKASEYSQLAGDDVIPPSDEGEDSD